MVVLTAHKLKEYTVAITFYAKVINQLRRLLKKQESTIMTDKVCRTISSIFNG